MVFSTKLKEVGRIYLSKSQRGAIIEIDGIPDKYTVSVTRILDLLNEKVKTIELMGE